jgi:hypothetical protein
MARKQKIKGKEKNVKRCAAYRNPRKALASPSGGGKLSHPQSL